MDIISCIETRRSVRSYEDKIISKEVLKQLIELGTKAATGSNKQPWAFLCIEGKEKLIAMSEQIKMELNTNIDQYPHLQQYQKWMTNPKFNVFNGASNAMVIYGDTSSYYYKEDCSLAAANIMLAAHSMAIGTCWLGFAEFHMNTPEFKKEHNIPDNFELVCAMSIGYSNTELDPPKRKEPIIFGMK
ncbi:MAG: nitroreductase family protein [Lachnospiraceae bacterium]